MGEHHPNDPDGPDGPDEDRHRQRGIEGAGRPGCGAGGARFTPENVRTPEPGEGTGPTAAGAFAGPAPSPGAQGANRPPVDSARRRLRRLAVVWPDDRGLISFLLTLCVQDRQPVLANERIFAILQKFLLDSPGRYGWFPRRFVIMPDHLHLMVHRSSHAVTLGDWVKALKAALRGRFVRQSGEQVPGEGTGPSERALGGGTGPSPGAGAGPSRGSFGGGARPTDGRVPLGGGTGPAEGIPFASAATAEASSGRRGKFSQRSGPATEWRWQSGFHDHKFRTGGSEARKWEYVALNPVRAKLVGKPEDWPFAGEFQHFPDGRMEFLPGIPALLNRAILMGERGAGEAR